MDDRRVMRHLDEDATGAHLLLALLVDKGLVDVGDDTTTSNGGLDQSVQFLITANGELQMAGSDTLHLKILGSVTGQLENLCKDRKNKKIQELEY